MSRWLSEFLIRECGLPREKVHAVGGGINVDAAGIRPGSKEGRRILFFYSLLVAALCIGLNGPLLRLFTTDAAAAAYGSTMLAFEGISYVFTAQKHLCEARLRGAQKMGLYLASNLGQIGLNLAACVLLVPRIGFSGFWLSTWISAPAGLALAALLARIGAKQQS